MSTPIPLVLPGSGQWFGNDGNWSSFQIHVGTPAQGFQVIPSLDSGEIWVPVAEGCPSGDTECAVSRGIEPVNGTQSQGFQYNASATWELSGLYTLPYEAGVYNNTGLYGLDTIYLGNKTSQQLSGQNVAGISTADFWLGSLGLGYASSEYKIRDTDIPSLLSTLKTKNLTASLSYGFSAGAWYHTSTAGLVIGGYDQSNFEPNDVEFQVGGSLNSSLQVNLQSLIVTNGPQGTTSIPVGNSGIDMTIDSAVSQLWLPRSMCDMLESSLGLSYDGQTELYFVNATARSRLLSANPQFAFTLAASSQSNVTTNIVLPYAAFDLIAGWPLANNDTRYFPIRRAANESQYVLGRTFLQEAYLVVDWERQNFTVAQSLHQSGVSDRIVPILPPVSSTSSNGTSTGVIAGAVVGAVVGVALLCIAGVLIWRRRRQRRAAALALNEKTAELESDKTERFEAPGGDHIAEIDSEESRKKHAEIMSNQVHELEESQAKMQLMSSPVFELPGSSVESELDSHRRFSYEK